MRRHMVGADRRNSKRLPDPVTRGLVLLVEAAIEAEQVASNRDSVGCVGSGLSQVEAQRTQSHQARACELGARERHRSVQTCDHRSSCIDSWPRALEMAARERRETGPERCWTLTLTLTKTETEL